MKTPDRIRQGGRVVRDGCGEGAARSEKRGGLAIDIPDGRTWAEHALNGSDRIRLHDVEAPLKGGGINEGWIISHGVRCVA
jgi:hypothetical protein